MDNKEKFAGKRSQNFAVRIVNLYKYLTVEKKEFVISKQILRAGTSIGANLAEAEYAQSKADFYSKVGISLKEAAETSYWLRLLNQTEYIDQKEYESLSYDLDPIIKILVKTIKTKTI